MRTITVGAMAAAMLFTSVPARSAEFFEDFDDGTYDTDCWTTDGDVSFDSGCCILQGTITNVARLKLKFEEWQPPVEMRATIVGYGDVSLIITSNCWGRFRTTAFGTFYSRPGTEWGPVPWPPGPEYDFRVLYDGSKLSLVAGGIGMGSLEPLALGGKTSIEFSSFGLATLDFISVNFVSIRLTITRSEDNVILMWPTDPPGFTLQSTTNLTLSEAWLTVPKVPDVVNESNVITQPISGVDQFYRLIK